MVSDVKDRWPKHPSLRHLRSGRARLSSVLLVLVLNKGACLPRWACPVNRAANIADTPAPPAAISDQPYL